MPEASIDWHSVHLSSKQQEWLASAGGAALGSVSGFEGFGSFHSENVEDLIRLPAESAAPPACFPVFARRVLTNDELAQLAASAEGDSREGSTIGSKRRRQEGGMGSPASAALLQSLVSRALPPCNFGKEFGNNFFTITDDITFINHGAFGSALSGAVAIKQQYEHYLEQEVVEFVDRVLLPLMVHSVRRLSAFLHAAPTQIVIIQNATFALNSAMRLIKQGDVVAFLDTEYLAVYKMLWFRCKEVGADLHELYISKHLHNADVMGSDERITEEICAQLPEGCTAVVIDYVTSSSALCFPIFTHIVPALRRRGVTKIIVDGAHAPLQLELNFDSLPPESQPTVFAGNLHKWFCAPKAAGFLWVREEDVESVHSAVLSHGAGDGLLSEFIWDGTRDYGAYLAIPALVDFWASQDCDRVRAACGSLLRQAVDMLTEAFRSRRVARCAPFMSLVELPQELQGEALTTKYIQDLLHDAYRIEVPVKRIEGTNYLRISAFVYNTPGDYAYLREAILSVAARWAASDERVRQLHLLQQEGSAGQVADLPCDERIRRQGGCGVSGLDKVQKPKKTAKFS